MTSKQKTQIKRSNIWSEPSIERSISKGCKILGWWFPKFWLIHRVKAGSLRGRSFCSYISYVYSVEDSRDAAEWRSAARSQNPPNQTSQIQFRKWTRKLLATLNSGMLLPAHISMSPAFNFFKWFIQTCYDCFFIHSQISLDEKLLQ